MGILKEAPTAPDLYGLPEHKITDIITEIDGQDVRMVCGVRRFGVVTWLYSCVMRADLLMIANRQACVAAEEALDLQLLMDRRRGH